MISFPRIVELSMDDLKRIVAWTEERTLTGEERKKLEDLLQSYATLLEAIGGDKATLRRLREILFSKSTEKTEKVLPQENASRKGEEQQQRKTKRKGHGRKGAADYHGAERIPVPHESLHAGDPCPECDKGTVYVQKKPAVIVRLSGGPPVSGKVFECERLRCHLCGVVFTAKAPGDVGEEKYDVSSRAIVALLKYGSGLPFNRLERLQGAMGVPLPASTQWELVRDAAHDLVPVHEELIRTAANGEVLHNDDTGIKILELMGQPPGEEEGISMDRTGIFTSGIVSTGGGQRIALFFSGRKHAGENLARVLESRAQELEAPIQMCDALSRNLPKELQVIVGNCLAHGRRYFVKLVDRFPDECRHVLETLGEVYKIDAHARKQRLSAQERLELHQRESRPVMDELETWFTEQIEEKKTEPNSPLGDAITYMQNHWEKLTLFLRQPGAPLDNNICERSLKRVILHRKNSLFFKTLNGARVSDVFMTLIHTAELSSANPFDYLKSLLEHSGIVGDAPDRWLPWNYREALAEQLTPP